MKDTTHSTKPASLVYSIRYVAQNYKMHACGASVVICPSMQCHGCMERLACKLGTAKEQSISLRCL